MRRFAYIAAMISLLLTGCGKLNEEETQKPQPAPTPASPVGTYVFDGQEYPVHTAVYADDGNVILITISPLQPHERLSTYAIIGINASLEGQQIDIENAWHNDDYYFRYEDPVRFYSEHRKLPSGTILIRKLGSKEDTFSIKVDVTLPDGTDFLFDYEGKIASATL